MSAHQDMELWLRSLIVIQLMQAAKRIQSGPLLKSEWETIKGTLLSALNDIDRVLDYGNPGAGIDRMLGVRYTNYKNMKIKDNIFSDGDDLPTNGDER